MIFGQVGIRVPNDGGTYERNLRIRKFGNDVIIWYREES